MLLSMHTIDMNTILHIWQAKVQALVECDFHSGITEQLIQIQTLKNISMTTTDSYNLVIIL